MNKHKIIIDTDIGDDIDDLLALYMALESDKIDIIGITTVYINSNLRARQTKKVLALKNRNDIPVFAGIGTPLRGLHFETTNVIFNQYTKDLDDNKYAPINDNEKCDGESAIDFLISSAKKYQNELTILCIGPLTNIARAILKDKEAMSKVNYIMMGGCFFKAEREWNIECDIDAANIVFNNKLKLTCLGTNVTKKVELTIDEQNYFLSAKHNDLYYKYLVEMINEWVSFTNRRIVLHDPLTLYYLINPNIFKSCDRHVYLVSKGDFVDGMTLSMEDYLWVQFDNIKKEKFSKCTLVKDVDNKKFIEEFLKIVKL